MQEIVAILVVGACVVYVGTQLLSTIRSGQGKAGKCCSRGCDVGEVKETSINTAPTTSRDHFIPSDLLRRKKV